MNFFVKEFLGGVLFKTGLRRSLVTSRPCSSKSAKPQRLERVKYKFEPIGGSPISEDAFGQPTCFTHPYHLSVGEIVPGVRVEEFKGRRHRLIESVKSFAGKQNRENQAHLIIIPGASKKFMTEKIPYVFRQNSDFVYLTGCMEPDCVLVLTSCNGKNESILFVRGKDPAQELWDGPRTGIEQALMYFDTDQCLPTTEFDHFLRLFVKDNNTCMLWYDYMSVVNPAVHSTMKECLSLVCNRVWESPKSLVDNLRLLKSPSEVKLMRKTCEIASKAIATTMATSQPGMNEGQLFARVDYECRMLGAQHLAYPPVVAGGARANIIHYISNDQVVNDGELVLMDAGCEYFGYSSDITRCWPISGSFTAEQRTLYEVVGSVQQDVIQLCRTFPSLDQLYRAMCRLLGKRLQEAGVLRTKDQSQEDLSRIAHSFCPHHVSHYLGMDVHDTASITRNRALEPGMVITVEPGVYVNATNKQANPAYHGLGIRIEDDVLITDSGPVVLTESCPKNADAIEKLIHSYTEQQHGS